MKKQFLLFAAATLLGISSLMAQENKQKKTPTEKMQATMEKLAVLNLDADAKAKTEVIFTEFYEARQKTVKEMRTAGTTDREAMKIQIQKIESERNEKLKQVFTEEQFKKWSDEVEPSMKSQKAKMAPAAN